MSITKNLVLNVTNDVEGITLTIKTVAIGDNGITITGDPGLFNLEEVSKALDEARKFVQGANNEIG